MKITALIGSQRKGNTLKLVKEVEKKLRERINNLEFEYVMLMDADIKTCVGCFSCLSKGIEKCPLHDDIPSIIKKMENSTGIIFASPVYVMNVTSNMKNFIDRLSAFCHRPHFFNQHALIVSTVGGFGLKDVLKYLKGVAGVWGMRSQTLLGATTPPVKEFPEKLKLKNEKAVRKGVTVFAEKLNSSGPIVPSMDSILQFHAQRAIFGADDSKEDFPADYEYFSKLRDKNYFVPAKVPFFKGLVGKFTGFIIPKFI
ncbi:MAG: flavodoxin family protein [bacterium]